jgi:hypothetical protein
MVTILEEPPSGRRLGWLEPVIPALPEAKRFSALSVGPCPSCGAPENVACDSPRVHQSRLDIALDRMRRGELPPAPEPEIARHGECSACGTERTQRGTPKACGDPSHRCQRILPTKWQCAAPVIPGTSYCRAHQPPPGSGRWTDRDFVPRGGR